MTHTPNVLLLDQDHVLRRATALLLSNRGACVAPAATLEEALALARCRIYDVAVIDLSPSLPRAGEILRRLRRDGMVPRRVVLCVDEPIPVEEAGDFSEVLRKPYDFEQLLASIFGQRGARRPTRSGIFPRLRVASGDGLRAVGQAPPGNVEGAPDLAEEAVALLSSAGEGGPRLGALQDRAVGRGGRRTRGVVAGRALRSPRRAPRGVRHPE